MKGMPRALELVADLCGLTLTQPWVYDGRSYTLLNALQSIL